MRTPRTAAAVSRRLRLCEPREPRRLYPEGYARANPANRGRYTKQAKLQRLVEREALAAAIFERRVAAAAAPRKRKPRDPEQALASVRRMVAAKERKRLIAIDEAAEREREHAEKVAEWRKVRDRDEEFPGDRWRHFHPPVPIIASAATVTIARPPILEALRDALKEMAEDRTGPRRDLKAAWFQYTQKALDDARARERQGLFGLHQDIKRP